MSNLLRLKKYFIKYKSKLILGIIFILISNVTGVYIPIVIRDSFNLLKSNFDYNNLVYYSLLIVGIALFSGFFRVMIRQTIIVVSREIEFDLRNDFWNHLQSLSIRYYNNNKTGDIMALATNDINSVRNFLGPAVMYTIDTFTIFVLTVGIMISINLSLTLLALVPFFILSLIVYKIGRSIHSKYTAIQEQFATLTAKAQENLSGIRIIKSYHKEESEILAFKNLSEEYFKKNMKLAKLQAWFYPLFFLVMGTSSIIILWLGGVLVIKKILNLGDIIAFIMYLEYLIWPAIAFGWITNIVQQAEASQKRLNEVFDLKPEISDSENTDFTLNKINGEIQFDGVTFAYRKDLSFILNRVNLQIPKGSTLAIVGKTGIGKSSIVNLILRLYDVIEGRILIDNIDIKKYPLKVLRNNIGYVSQETFLFSETLRNNITFGVDKYSEEDLQKVIEISQLKKDIESFPDGLETVIGERGITLSGGQKQRVSLARVLIKKPAILILDDCLSAVDTYTEEEILKQLKVIMKERTSIIVSHRISTIKDADKIIVLADETIKEMGDHDELLKLNGIYAEMFRRQLLEEELESIG